MLQYTPGIPHRSKVGGKSGLMRINFVTWSLNSVTVAKSYHKEKIVYEISIAFSSLNFVKFGTGG